jgi:hypothetical protein
MENLTVKKYFKLSKDGFVAYSEVFESIERSHRLSFDFLIIT